MRECLTSRRRVCRALPALLTFAFLGFATTGAPAERRPDRTTTPPDPAATVAPAASAADPALEAAVDRLRHAVAAAPPSPALGRGFEGLDMVLLARTAEGHVRALSAPPGRGFPLPRGVSGDDAPAAFLAKHAVAFGVAKPDVRFVAERAKTVGNRRVVRLRQEFRAIPVFGAAALVQVGPGGVEFVLADLARDQADLHAEDFDTAPSTGKDAAESVALSLVRGASSAPDLVVDEPQLMIFEPSVIGERGSEPARLARPRAERRGDVDEVVLVDAHVGDVAFHYSRVKEAKSRPIYDANNVSGSLGTLVRSEGGPPSGDRRRRPRLHILRRHLRLLLHPVRPGQLRRGGPAAHRPGPLLRARRTCPFANAYWNGSRDAVRRRASPAADDVVAHELTHGVTERESNLIYWDESGRHQRVAVRHLRRVRGPHELRRHRHPGRALADGRGRARRRRHPQHVRTRPSSATPTGASARTGGPAPRTTGASTSTPASANKLAYLLTDGGTFNGQTVAAPGDHQGRRSSSTRPR